MKRALVTGCAGFIGSHLTERLLKEGFEVIGIDRFSDYYSRTQKEQNLVEFKDNSLFTLIESDICEMDSFPDVDIVFHLAAQAGVRASWGVEFSTYIHDNIEATQCLLEWYKNKSCEKFIYSSSSSVYGNAALPLHESQVLHPISPYGVTKLAGEHLCMLYYYSYRLPVVALRYFTVYGPRQRPDMAIHKFMKKIQSGKKIVVYGDGNQTRDFTYVDDVVEANVRASEHPVQGSVFNVGGGNNISVLELISVIENSMNEKVEIKFNSIQKGDVNNTLADTTLIKDKIGWRPSTGINEGIALMAEWFHSFRSENCFQDGF